jgi:predicted transcriptional regulator
MGAYFGESMKQRSGVFWVTQAASVAVLAMFVVAMFRPDLAVVDWRLSVICLALVAAYAIEKEGDRWAGKKEYGLHEHWFAGELFVPVWVLLALAGYFLGKQDPQVKLPETSLHVVLGVLLIWTLSRLSKSAYRNRSRVPDSMALKAAIAKGPRMALTSQADAELPEPDLVPVIKAAKPAPKPVKSSSLQPVLKPRKARAASGQRPDDAKMLELLKAHPDGISCTEVVAETGLAYRTAFRYLDDLVQRKMVRKTGAARATRYFTK